MRLLSTDRAEFREFNGPDDPEIKGGYAILSHTWARGGDTEEPEQSFTDIEQIKAECAVKEARFLAKRLRGAPPQSYNPRDYVSKKIRESCIIAEQRGFKWIWNDTCCIDKRSSSELSEAINSMYRYYSLAGICIAYLVDVEAVASPSLSSRDPMDPSTFAFRDSLWHKRGWTLQELIAPRTLIFYSKTWTSLGTKSDLVTLLVNATGIPDKVFEDAREILQFPLAQRLSWMSMRKTTRVEDRAYCLLGILGISMTTLYGEGDRAFLRLQEKLMKMSDDTSIFAWGLQMDWETLCESYVPSTRDDHDKSHRYLLSASHEVFQRSGQLTRSLPPSGMFNEREALPVSGTSGTPSTQPDIPPSESPTFSMTHHGLRCSIPVFHAQSFAVAALFCFDGLQGSHLGLILIPCTERKSSPLVYHTGWTPPESDGLPLPARIVRLGTDPGTLHFRGLPAQFRWEEIYIAARPPPQAFAAPENLFAPGPLFGGFRLPHSTFAALTENGWEHILNAKVPPDWASPDTFDILFGREGPEDSYLIFALGRCSVSEGWSAHWASFWVIPGPNDLPDDHAPPLHRCPDDHISEWHDRRKLFTERYSGYSFPFAVAVSPCTISHSALVLDVAEGKPGLGRFGQSWFRA